MMFAMIRKYLKVKRKVANENAQALAERISARNEIEPTFKERWSDYWSQGGVAISYQTTYHLVMSPLYLIYAIWCVFLLLTCWIWIPAFILMAFIYIPSSLIIGGSIDLFRNLFLKKGDYWIKWEYTDNMLDWWGLTPYGMSIEDYRGFKKEHIFVPSRIERKEYD